MSTRPALRRTRPSVRDAGLLLAGAGTFLALTGVLIGPMAGAGLATATATVTAAPSPVAKAAATAATVNVGLFGAQDPTYDGVYRQSLAIIGLIATGHTPDPNATAWLIAQQCADGAFTAYRANTAVACTAASEDENATAAAIQALVALGKPTATAVAALKKFQLPDGGFYDNTAFGPAASDVNSTGLALSALVAGGIDPSTVTSSSGKHADDYLRTLQIPCAAASGAGAFDFQGEATLHANDYATVQALLGQLGKALPVAPGSPAAAVPACPAAVTDAVSSASAATSYLAARLTATNGAIPSAFGTGKDWTSTANAVLDLQAAGAGATAVTAGLTALQANVQAYSRTGGKYAAGPLGTLLLVAHATGVNPASFGGVDLAAALAATERLAAAPTPSRSPSQPAPSPSRSASGTGTSGGTLPSTGAQHVTALGSLAVALLTLGSSALVVARRLRASRQRG